MRDRSCVVAVVAMSFALVACGDGSDDSATSNTSPMTFGSSDTPSGTTTNGATKGGTTVPSSGTADPSTSADLATDVDPATKTHPEVVQLLMAGKDSWTWFCTGALVSSTVVVTAAHCLQTDKFLSWQAIAPTLRAKPRVKGQPAMYDAAWDDVAHPDLGIVKLEKPIDLPVYAKLVDVTARVGAEERLDTGTIVRTLELPEAPFMKKGSLGLFSTAKYGYAEGYGVPMYSHGGDSGAGMFLVTNGQMTHDLVAVEREPDPARKTDHLSRITQSFIAWVAKNGQ